MTKNRFSLLILPILAVALVVPFLACKDADPVTGVRPEATPTPRQPASLAGAWTGTFLNDDCINVPAEADFTQDEFVVFGVLNAIPDACGSRNVRIRGTFSGNTLRGTIESSQGRYAFGPGSTVTGSLSADGTLRITLVSWDGPNRGGSMNLHR